MGIMLLPGSPPEKHYTAARAVHERGLKTPLPLPPVEHTHTASVAANARKSNKGGLFTGLEGPKELYIYPEL